MSLTRENIGCFSVVEPVNAQVGKLNNLLGFTFHAKTLWIALTEIKEWPPTPENHSFQWLLTVKMLVML